MAQQLYFGRPYNATLSEQEVQKFNRVNRLIIRPGDRGYVLPDTVIIAYDILDENGQVRYTKEGRPIRSLVTICIVIRKDGTISVGQVTLGWLAGEDLYVEGKCPLLLCKDGVRKYAATWKLTKVEIRDFNMDLVGGQGKIDHMIAFVGGDPVEGYLAPSLDDVWTRDSTGAYVNVAGLEDEMPLKRVQRASLVAIASNDLDKQTLKKIKHLRDVYTETLNLRKD